MASVKPKKARPASKQTNPLVSHDLEAILIGVFIVLFGVLGFTNMTLVSGIFNYTVTVFIGNASLIGFAFIIFLGFYRIIRRKAFQIKFSSITLGSIIFFVSGLGLFTHYILQSTSSSVLMPLRIDNFFAQFKAVIPLLKDLPTTYSIEVSGGLIGFLILGLANSIVGISSGFVVLYALAFVGVLIATQRYWRRLFAYLRKRKSELKQERQRLQQIKETEPTVSATPPVSVELRERPSTKYVTPRIETSPAYAKSVRAQSPTSGLKKVSYVPKQQRGKRIEQKQHEQPLPQDNNLSRPVYEPPRMKEQTSEKLPIKEAMEEIEQPQIEQQQLNQQNTPSIPKQALPNYEFPSVDLIDDVPEDADFEYNDEMSLRRLDIINQTFIDLNVKASAVSYKVGPSFTSFDIQLERGTLVKTVSTVINEISIRLGGMPALFTEVVPGKTTSTLEVPNEKVSIVSFKEILRELDNHPELDGRVVFPFGKNILGKLELLPLKDIIHMLVCGTTGSGKSVFMHSVIMTILMRSRPDEIKLLIIDPKQVEMMRYEELPHLLAPIINDYSHAKAALTKLLEEMANRYELFKQVGISSIDAYNRYARDNGIEPLPLIATIIDEYADLVDGIPAISDIVERLAAMSRAAGIHLIIATQRPTTKVVSGNIKNNIITKVALQMNAPVDSVTVLGHAGAEKLLGNGDMIVSCPKLSRYGELRLQGAFVSEEDTLRVVDFYKKRYQPSYHPAFANILDEGSGVSLFPGFSFTQSDEQYEQIKAFTLTQEYMSSNRIMREFKVGFSRSKEIILQLQDEGVLAQGPDSPQSNKGIKVIANGENI